MLPVRRAKWHLGFVLSRVWESSLLVEFYSRLEDCCHIWSAEVNSRSTEAQAGGSSGS